MFKRLLTMILVMTVLLSACNLPTSGAVSDNNLPAEAVIQTKAAQTVEAMGVLLSTPATATTGAQRVTPPVVTVPVVATVAPVATLAPTATRPPISTPIIPTIAPTAIPIPCDRALFVSETIPDGTLFSPGTTFTKTWTLQNNGSCTWNTGYRVIFTTGDAMGAPAGGITLPSSVAPGGTIALSVTLTVPSDVRTYQGNFMLQNASGARFGIGSGADKAFWVNVVVGSTATPTTFAVSTTSLTVSPTTYDGSCTSGIKFTFNGTITTNRSGTVQYHFLRSDGASGPTQSLVFSGAGSQSVSTDWTLSGSINGWEQIYIDSPNHQAMAQAGFTLTCH
jgi:hypothetical protein